MKTKLLILTLAVLATAGTVAQTQQKPPSATPKMNAEQQAMMDALQKAGAIGANHKLLQSFVGEWSYAVKIWMDPAAPPAEGTGNTSYRSLMDGRFVQHEHTGTLMDMPFHGIGLFGYDNVTKQFQEHFFENSKTGQMLLNGSYDDASKTFTFRGEIDDVMKPGTKVKVRETIRVPDANTLVLEWFETRAGKETKAMEVTYKRKE